MPPSLDQEYASPNFRPSIIHPIVILSLLVFFSFVPAMIAPRTQFHFLGMGGGWAFCFVLALVWWTIRSRVRGAMRWVVPLLAIGVGILAIGLYPNPSLALLVLLNLVMTTILWCGIAILTHPFGWPIQKKAILGSLFLSVLLTLMVRIDGTSAELFQPEVAWRWNPRPEDKAISERNQNIVKADLPQGQPYKLTPDDWAQFRGVNQDSVLNVKNIRVDWDKNPPKELWRKKVGPCWGSCIVVGDTLYTQEQLGGDEAVTCMNAVTGDLIWTYKTPDRFEEAISGVGPRGTPTYHDGFIYTFGAKGKLTKLNASTGGKVWEISTPEVTKSSPPGQFWGFASSPFIVDDMVVVFMSGGPGKGTAAFATGDGSLIWCKGDGRHGYCTAHRTTIAGIDQLLIPSDIGIEAHDPKTGNVLWSYLWPTRGNRSTQTVLLGNDEVLLPTGYGVGTRRLKITKSNDTWDTKTIWETKKFKPYYNDCVVHDGMVFGFDDKAFVCLDPKTGQIAWNAGSIYGLGQVLLLAEQKMLVVQAESGHVVLVEANAQEHIPIARIPVFAKKSWNHPVISRGRLYVRNSEEIVCFDVSGK